MDIVDRPDDAVNGIDAVLITAELDRRPSRPPDFEAENRALTALAGEMAVNPGGVLRRLAETVLELCRADSAGISILEPSGPDAIFRWHAVVGPFAANVGGTIPRDASPCGTVIERNGVLLFDRPGQYFPALRGAEPPIFEGLLAPWPVGGEAVGTVWVLGHSPERRFDAEDARLLASLSRFAAAAHQMAATLDASEVARRELERRADARRRANEALRREAEERARAEERQRLLLRELQHRVKNNLQTIAGLVHLQERRTRSAEGRRELLSIARRIEALGLAYDRLYAAGEVERVDLRAYFERLEANLLQFYAEAAPGVRLHAEVGDLVLPLDTAVALGLIVNEFVTNSFKYAFEGRPGLIGLKVERTDAGRGRLRLWDDGKGMPRECSAGTGLSLIEGLARQIGGSADFEANGGTRLTVEFDL